MRWTPERLIKLAQDNQRRDDVEERLIILGYNRHGNAVLGELSSFLIGGQPKMGKSSIAAHLCWSGVVAGGLLIIVDPHLHSKKRGLFTKVSPLSPWFAQEAVDFTDLDVVVSRFDWLEQEQIRREGRGGMIGARPIFLVVDEFNVFLSRLDSEQEATVARVISNVARGGGKFGLFTILCAHNWELSLSGGGPIRKNVVGRIAAPGERGDLSTILGIRNPKQLNALCTPELVRGDAIVKHPTHGLMRLRYPYTDETDCAVIARMMGDIAGRGVPGTFGVRGVVKQEDQRETTLKQGAVNENRESVSPRETAPEGHSPRLTILRLPLVGDDGDSTHDGEAETAETIKRLYREGKPHREIAQAVKMSGPKYKTLYQPLCKQLGIPLRKEPAVTEEDWQEIKRRYDYRCPSCGRCEPEITLTKDHIVPRESFGPSSADNIQPLCIECNQAKHTRTEVYQPGALSPMP
jgi:HNH endonuclease